MTRIGLNGYRKTFNLVKLDTGLAMPGYLRKGILMNWSVMDHML